MKGCCSKRKPLSKPRQKKACVAFVRAYVDNGEKYRDSILRILETKVNLFGTTGIQTAWRHKGEEYNEKWMLPTVKHGGGSDRLWGCMSAAGVGELHFTDGIANSQMYWGIPKDKVLPSLCALGCQVLPQHGNFYFSA